MSQRIAVLYRMVLPDHECPYGRRAKQLLEEQGFRIEEHILSTRDEVDAIKERHGLNTTPLILIDGKKIGGCEELEDYLRSEGSV